MSAMQRAMTIAAFLVATLPLTAYAVAEDALEITTVVEKEVVVETDNGEERVERVIADVVTPGERVIYTITFRNVGTEPAGNVVITNPIAESLTYVAGSATSEGATVEFSIDGGQSFAPASQLRVVDGGIERPATTRDYTHVRWVMQTELAVGADGQMSFAADLE
ncbi:MAG: hypothetical protein AAFX10_09215 [Pseudomonadota bacterium]